MVWPTELQNSKSIIAYLSDIYIEINFKKTIMKLTKEQIMGIIRHTLTFVGGIFIMKGLVDEPIVNEIVGGVMTLTGAIWSIVEKK